MPRHAILRVGPDRFQLLAQPRGRAVPPEIVGYRVVRDSIVRRQTSIPGYSRVREYVDPILGTRVFLQYRSVRPGLPPFKVTVVGNDSRNLSAREFLQVVRVFKSYRLLLLELAFDFPAESEIDIEFVRLHALFGKCRPAPTRLFPNRALYGARKADKFVRCYLKESVGCFRVELELHSAWLRRNGILKFGDLGRLPGLLFPNHIRFVRFNWTAFTNYLARRRVTGDVILDEARTHSYSIHRLMQFLRKDAGIVNVHRFLIPLPINRAVQTALQNWSRQF